MKRSHKPFDVKAAIASNPTLAKLNPNFYHPVAFDVNREPVSNKYSPKANLQIKRSIKESQGEKLNRRFNEIWAACDGPPLEKEHRFHGKRKFRFDYIIQGATPKIAIELEGGIWRKQGGAHSGGVAANRDCVKYNLAACHGWTVFRLTTDLISQEFIQPIINFYKLGPI